MYRFLFLYVGTDGLRGFAEGLILIDGAVYCYGFFPEVVKLYGDLNALRRAMRDNDNILSWPIQMIDEVEVRVNGI